MQAKCAKSYGLMPSQLILSPCSAIQRNRVCTYGVLPDASFPTVSGAAPWANRTWTTRGRLPPGMLQQKRNTRNLGRCIGLHEVRRCLHDDSNGRVAMAGFKNSFRT